VSKLGETMKVLSVTKQRGGVQILEIAASPEEYGQEEARVYQRLRREVKIPGFRRGKVPHEVLRGRFGEAAQADALDACVSGALAAVLEQEELVPLSEPIVRDVERTDDGGVSFTAEVGVLPKLDLPDVTKLHVTREVEEVSDQRVEERLEGLRRMAARVTSVDRGAGESDMVRFRYQRLDPSGVPLVGTTVEDNSLVVGEREELRPFWEAMRGAKAGEIRDFSVSSEAAGGRGVQPGQEGQEQRYRVTVTEVCERQLPGLDDEFAKDLGQFETLEDLRQHLRSRLEEEAEETATRRAEEEILRKVIEKSGVDPSPSLVERYLSSLVDEARQAHTARDDGRPFDESHVREAHRPEAIAQVSEYLVLRRIAKDEELEPRDEEVRSLVVSMSGREASQDDIATWRGKLREMKVREFLLNKAKVKEVRRKPSASPGRVIIP
jgi:trigger factor